jgi:hypothetical protein
MLDIPMAQILLQGTGIDAFIGQVKSTRMPEGISTLLIIRR